MLTTETKSHIKMMAGISDSAIIKWPVTNFNPTDKSIIAFLDLEKLGEPQFEQFGIYRISEFLQLLDYYDDASVGLDGNVITIKSASTVQRYITTNENNLTAFDVSSAILDKIAGAPLVGTIQLSKDELDRTKKISNLLNLPELGITSDGSEIEFTIQANTGQSNIQAQNDNRTVMEGQPTESFDLTLKVESIQKLPACDYTIEVHRNAASGSYITQWNAVDLPITIIVMPKAD